MERDDIANDMVGRTKTVDAFQKLLNDVARDWKDERNRIIGHVTLSDPSVSTMATKTLQVIGPSLRFIPLRSPSSTLSGTSLILAPLRSMS